MNLDELKRVVMEEVLRALAELGVVPRPAPAPLSGPALGMGLVILTGSEPPAAPLLDALDRLGREGAEIVIVPSLTFRQTQAGKVSDRLRRLNWMENPDDEAAALEATRRARWLLFPDASFNTLAKAALGIEDSAPTRALAAAARFGAPRVLLECRKPETPAAGAERHNLLRQAQSTRGARLAEPATLLETLREAVDPPRGRPFASPPPKPPVRLPIVTKEDVYEAFAQGLRELEVPANSIVTMEAREDAERRGMEIRRRKKV